MNPATRRIRWLLAGPAPVDQQLNDLRARLTVAESSVAAATSVVASMQRQVDQIQASHEEQLLAIRSQLRTAVDDLGDRIGMLTELA